MRKDYESVRVGVMRQGELRRGSDMWVGVEELRLLDDDDDEETGLASRTRKLWGEQ